MAASIIMTASSMSTAFSRAALISFSPIRPLVPMLSQRTKCWNQIFMLLPMQSADTLMNTASSTVKPRPGLRRLSTNLFPAFLTCPRARNRRSRRKFSSSSAASTCWDPAVALVLFCRKAFSIIHLCPMSVSLRKTAFSPRRGQPAPGDLCVFRGQRQGIAAVFTEIHG